MDSSREKRITLRFYMDDPIAAETFSLLMQRRKETGAVMNTLIVELIHRGLCREEKLLENMEALEKMFRDVIRTEGRSLLCEWQPSAPQKVIPEPQVDDRQWEGQLDDDELDDDESLDQVFAFCNNMT